MKTVHLIMLGLILTTTPAWADETQFCSNPFTDFSLKSPDQLRRIAKSRESSNISGLYYNRAYHIELISEYRKLSALYFYRKSNDARYIESQRMLTGLLEAFAYDAWKKGDMSAIESLAGHYDQVIEKTEYLLRGNELLAKNSDCNPSGSGCKNPIKTPETEP